jgi:hypothetical protein
MKQFLLATALIALPVAAFSAYMLATAPATITQAALGDLSALQTIVTDVQTITAKGDLAAAETRITDFETAWDDAQAQMRPLNPAAWGAVDGAADAALSALRSVTPNAADVTTNLATLSTTLANPTANALGTVVAATTIAGIAVTDDTGRSLPCEVMLQTLATALTTAKLSPADQTTADDLHAKALERCNADDDAHADEFSAQALALVSQ